MQVDGTFISQRPLKTQQLLGTQNCMPHGKDTSTVHIDEPQSVCQYDLSEVKGTLKMKNFVYNAGFWGGIYFSKILENSWHYIHNIWHYICKKNFFNIINCRYWLAEYKTVGKQRTRTGISVNGFNYNFKDDIRKRFVN